MSKRFYIVDLSKTKLDFSIVLSKIVYEMKMNLENDELTFSQHEKYNQFVHCQSLIL